MSMFTCIDLFSGVGGIQYGLRGLCKPYLYCDINEFAQKVLKKNMAAKLIPKAPILNDVRDIKGIMQTIKGRPVDMVIFTSSCKGFSTLTHVGLAHEETKFFLDAIELVKLIKPQIVFVENVPGIVTANDGADYAAIKKMFEQMDYSLDYGIFSAADLGAPHLRKRWYALATHNSVDRPQLRARVKKLMDKKRVGFPTWSIETEKNFQHRVPRSPYDRERMSAMGNAVVPLCVRNAFHKLVFGVDLVPPQRIDRNIVLDPNIVNVERRPRAKVPPVTEPLYRNLLPTPRAGNVHGCLGLTYRCSGDLPTAIRFMVGMRGTRDAGLTNSELVEYMMGYPQGYTRI